MFASKMWYIDGYGELFMENQCDLCQAKPAVRLEADCHGDAVTLCRTHWEEYFKNEILTVFDIDIDSKFEKTNIQKFGRDTYRRKK